MDPIRLPESHLTDEQAQRVVALKTAGEVTGKKISTIHQAVGATAGLQVLPGDLVRIAHWIVTGESVIITDDETLVMRDDAGWTRISLEGPAKAPAGDGHVFWAPLGATRDPEFAEGFERRGEEGDMFAGPAWEVPDDDLKAGGETPFRKPMEEHIVENYGKLEPEISLDEDVQVHTVRNPHLLKSDEDDDLD